MSGGGPSVPSESLTGRRSSIASALRTSLARRSCAALALSVIEPPPTVTIRSAPAARAILAASITACRCVRWHVVEQAGKPVAERAAHLGDLLGRPVQ